MKVHGWWVGFWCLVECDSGLLIFGAVGVRGWLVHGHGGEMASKLIN
jgi:hypothetical protein